MISENREDGDGGGADREKYLELVTQRKEKFSCFSKSWKENVCMRSSDGALNQ